jgi:hypothetical protein
MAANQASAVGFLRMYENAMVTVATQIQELMNQEISSRVVKNGQ